jgi:hypothetical protein
MVPWVSGAQLMMSQETWAGFGRNNKNTVKSCLEGPAFMASCPRSQAGPQHGSSRLVTSGKQHGLQRTTIDGFGPGPRPVRLAKRGFEIERSAPVQEPQTSATRAGSCLPGWPQLWSSHCAGWT